MYNYGNAYGQAGYDPYRRSQPQQESGFEFEDESGSQYENEDELIPEFNTEQNYEDEFEYEDESAYEGEAAYEAEDEAEREEEYQYEDEFEEESSRNVRDHRRTGGTGSRRPSGSSGRQRPYTPRSGVRVSPRAGAAPYYRMSRPGYIGFGFQRQNYRNNPYRAALRPWRNRYWGQSRGYSTQPYGYSNLAQSGFADYDAGTAATPAASAGIPSYLMDTIQSLSRQLAATNANVNALQQSMLGPGNSGSMAAPEGPAPQGAAAAQPGSEGPQSEMEDYEYHMESEMDGEMEQDEMEEMELAAELLATNNDRELDHFLGGLSGPLKGILRSVIKTALPVAGAAAGTFFGGPVGTAVGGKLGSAASNMFELELEGLSLEDQEFEVARALVRLTNDAAASLDNVRPSGNEGDDARNALISAAMRHAPGLLMRKSRRNQ